MDKFVIIRSLADSDGGHDAYQCMTGRQQGERQPPRRLAGRRAPGSRKLQGPVNPAVPPHLALMYADRQPHLGRARRRRLPRHRATARSISSAAKPASTRDNMVLQGHHARPAAGPRRSLRVVARPLPPRGRHQPARMDGIDVIRADRRWASSPTRSWPTPSTCRRKTRRSSTATARATRSSSATAPADGRELLHRPPAGRGRCPLRDAELQPLGLARRRRHELPKSREDFPLLDHGPVGPGHRPARARPGSATSSVVCGASSAARRRSTTRTAATTGRRPTPASWPAAACGPAR